MCTHNRSYNETFFSIETKVTTDILHACQFLATSYLKVMLIQKKKNTKNNVEAKMILILLNKEHLKLRCLMNEMHGNNI